MSTNRRHKPTFQKPALRPKRAAGQSSILNDRAARETASAPEAPSSLQPDRAPSDFSIRPDPGKPNNKHEIPTVSRADERSAASERARTYAYRFPRDRRQLGGKFSVQENA